jgi:Carboxypeptidase regulatory-like domain
MTLKRISAQVSLLVLLPIAAVSLFGQGVTQGVRGTVSDPSGAFVPGATVRAINIATGVPVSTVTTSAGVYSITSLNAAVYRIEAEKSGFKRLVRDNVAVPLGVIVGLDLTLEVGQTTQTVEVTGAPPMVEKETTQLNTSINPKSYLDLPLNASGGRSIETFISLAPGVFNGGSSFANTANGGQIFSRQVKVDGLDIGNVLAQPGDTSKVLTLPPDAVNEFSYVTLTPPADTGNNMAGTMQYTMRSGTNQIHGSAYEFYRGNVFQSRNPFQGNLSRYNQNEYGFTLGGPVYIPHVYNGKNRTFWFFNFNGYSQRSAPQSHFITLPTAQEHLGDFSDYPYPIYDPATTTPLPGGGYTRTQFPGNIIPSNRINQTSALVASGIPSPPAVPASRTTISRDP